MSSVVINGDTSGSVTLSAPAVAGSTVLTLPSTSGTVLTTASGQWITSGSDIYYNTGNVGIGTTSPVRKLNISGSGVFGASTGATVRLDNTTSGRPGIIDFDDSQNLNLWANTDTGSMRFFTATGAGSERMRIDSGGRLLLNQSSNNGTYLMQMIQQSSTSGAMLIQIATNGNNGVSFLNAGGAAQVGTIVVNSGSTAYNTSSDYRLKENITPMTGALDKIAQLKPVTYKWKADGTDGQGFVAHELQEVVPDCVTGEKDAVDADGKPVYQGIDVSFLVATLTAAIQELKAELDTVKAELAALKG